MTLEQLFAEYGYVLSAEVAAKLAASQAAQDAAISAQIAALTGQDSEVTAVLTKIKAMLDAAPGTPEFDEGENLFTLIANRYSALSASLAATNGNVVKIADQIAQFVLGLSDLTSRVSALEAGAVVMGAAIATTDGKVNDVITAVAAAAGAMASYLAHIKAGLNGDPRPSGN